MFSYEKVGEKIKGLAKVLFILAMIASIFSGVLVWNQAVDFLGFLIGLLIMIFGSIFGWVSTWLLYGFGELIETVSAIKFAITETYTPSQNVGVKKDILKKKRFQESQGETFESNFQNVDYTRPPM